MRIGLLLLLPLLASCAGINPKPVTGPHGYTVFAQTSETVVVPLMDGGQLSVPERSMRIECD